MKQILMPLIGSLAIACSSSAVYAAHAGSSHKPDAATAAAPAEAAQGDKTATRSRSNIQNNREAPTVPATPGAEPAPQPDAVLKTKTKSNQSND